MSFTDRNTDPPFPDQMVLLLIIETEEVMLLKRVFKGSACATQGPLS
jgi:hypothetical protein